MSATTLRTVLCANVRTCQRALLHSLFRTLLQGSAPLLVLLLSACANLPEPQKADWSRHQQVITSLQQWSLTGRLNIRQERQSDTVSLNWEQDHQAFSIRMSGTMGLGAVYLHGNEQNLTLEKSGEEAQILPGLDSVSRDYLGYDFPASYLLYWVRGLPVPALTAQSTFNEQSLLQTLVQTDAKGQRWELAFERYLQVDTAVLPGRIRMRSQGVQLTFSINKWQVPTTTER